jgi:hypothetical protein
MTIVRLRDEGKLTARFTTRLKLRPSCLGAATRASHLVDAVAARFGEFDDVYLVGLADTDWTKPPASQHLLLEPAS